MRIAFLVNAFPTLSETFILDQITYLLDRGHDVEIFARFRPVLSKSHDRIQTYRLADRTHYVPLMPDKNAAVALKGMRIFLRGFVRSPLVFLKALNALKYGKDATNLSLLYFAAAFAGKGPFDIIHAHFGPNGLWALRLREIGAVEGGIITTFHGADVTVVPRRRGLQCYRALFDAGVTCTYSSDFVGRHLREMGAESRQLVKLPVGVDPERFDFRKREKSKNEKVTVVTIARLVEVKGVSYALRAMAETVGAFPAVRYVIVGDGPLRPNLERLAARLGIQEVVSFLGARTHEQIRALLEKADVFVLSSTKAPNGAEEAQGLVLLEAQAAGLPVVATRVGGIPESVLDEVSGFVVPDRDTRALAERLIYLCKHPERRATMGRAGRKHVAEKYNAPALNARLVELYHLA